MDCADQAVAFGEAGAQRYLTDRYVRLRKPFEDKFSTNLPFDLAKADALLDQASAQGHAADVEFFSQVLNRQQALGLDKTLDRKASCRERV